MSASRWEMSRTAGQCRLSPRRWPTTNRSSAGTPNDGTGDVEGGRGLRAARNYKRVRERDPPFEIGDLRLAAAREIGGDDLEMPLQRAVLRGVGGQFRANREELALHPQDDRVP